MPPVGFEIKKLFFDRPAVMSKVKPANLRALSRFGAFVRRRARSSLRRRKKTSAAGSPPSVHSPSRESLKMILFGYDAGSRSLIVGPIKLNQKQTAIDTGSKSVPEIHEEGGTVLIREKSSNRGKTWRRRPMNRALRPWEIARTRRAHYPPRPFMLPAFNKEKEASAELWRDSISA